MNIRQAEYILAVHKSGSISKAARQLFISQPALSQAIRLAEQSLGAPIFERGTVPLRLTYAGERYVAAARQLLQIDANLKMQISEINGEERGRLRFGISRQRSPQLIPAALAQFWRRYPGVELLLEEHGSEQLEAMVEDGTVDLALATVENRRERVEYQLVEPERLVLLAGGHTNLARSIEPGTEIDIERAVSETFVFLKSGHSVRGIQDRIFAKKKIYPSVLVETDSLETAMRTAVACESVMICPHVYLQDRDVTVWNAVVYPLKYTGFERASCLCYRKGSYLPQYARDWMRWIVQQITDK